MVSYSFEWACAWPSARGRTEADGVVTFTGFSWARSATAKPGVGTRARGTRCPRARGEVLARGAGAASGVFWGPPRQSSRLYVFPHSRRPHRAHEDVVRAIAGDDDAVRADLERWR